MITGALISAVGSFVAWVGSLLPTIPIPATVNPLVKYGSGVGAVAVGIHNWVPVDTIFFSLSFMLVLSGVMTGIRLVRIVASFLTAGGGSAA